MTMKKGIYFLLFVSLLLFLALYNMIDENSSNTTKISEHAQKKINKLIDELDTARKKLKLAEDKINLFEAEQKTPTDEKSFEAHPKRKIRGKSTTNHDIKSVLNHSLQCGIEESLTDVQMLDTYEIMKFDNQNGGVWRQGWDITYDEDKVIEEDRLDVIVVPHSHCDPGWLKTFEEYYKQQTKSILDGMASNLKDKENMRFIYAEMSFFQMWWKDQSAEVKADVKSFLEKNQFEIVTGGWVMTDEANAHYHSMIVELIEGHEFILNNLGKDAKPRSHWSIDPFGLTPTLPYLMTLANVTQAAVQRVHYEVKKELARKKNLEFKWKQLFSSSHEMLTHVFPFYSYDVPHTCGPNPKICCQFDFRRLPEGGKSCDWGVPPEEISNGNVEKRSHMIYDQWRKKSQLYKTNTLLIPLGDDFRYDIQFEWDAQHNNYQNLFAFMNKKKEWNINARFGTLNDYFTTLKKNLKEEPLPSLSGDFFTYADRDDHYWSGYFTSRPFYKQLNGVLRNWLRTAEIFGSLSSLDSGEKMDSELYTSLVSARRALSLFQHHDGVTGTAKDHVVNDYGQKMLDALKVCEDVVSASVNTLLGERKRFKVEEVREQQDILPENHVYKVGESLVLMNSLTTQKNETVCILVDNLETAVTTTKGVEIVQQISPAFTVIANDLKMREGIFELCLEVKLNPLSVMTMNIVEDGKITQKTSVSSNFGLDVDGFDVSDISTNDVTVSNDRVIVSFDASTGLIKAVEDVETNKKTNVAAGFVNYGVRKLQKFTNGGTDYPSGAYLFLPDGPAKKVETEKNDFVIINGPVSKKVVIRGNKDLNLVQTYRLDRTNYYVDIDTVVDITGKNNYELALRFITDVKSGDRFFTDLNGFQNIRRKRFSKLPIQANYYPMVSGAFIEDDETRLTLFSGQPLGVSSMKEGELEVMLDRRLSADDGRGLVQGVMDNKRTLSKFRLLVESLEGKQAGEDAHYELHSAYGHLASYELNYPTGILFAEGAVIPTEKTFLQSEVNCDMQLVTLRLLTEGESSIAKREAAMIIHTAKPNCRSKLNEKMKSCRSHPHKIWPRALFPKTTSARNATLTLLYDGIAADSFEVLPHEVKTIRLAW